MQSVLVEGLHLDHRDSTVVGKEVEEGEEEKEGPDQSVVVLVCVCVGRGGGGSEGVVCVCTSFVSSTKDASSTIVPLTVCFQQLEE